MAYVAVESDERLEEGDSKVFAQPPEGNIGDRSPRESQGRGYISDAANASFWNVDYYQHHFDVDTKTVRYLPLYQHTQPLLPYIYFAHLTPAPDLYGPFWSLTTLIFTLFVTSSLATPPVEYDFALLSTAVGLVYAYGIGVPVMLWGVLRYIGISEGWAMGEAVTVWGYGMFVWIPVSVHSLHHSHCSFRWILVGIGFAVSGYFLVANIYPVLLSADQKPVRLLIVLIAVLHAVVALLFKVLFFSYYIETNIGPLTL
ncbi:hypothetical protein B0F90DRAFT_1728852 [Multifurca ochricompacta]|uniref:Protein YIP n=1 Tax=Multifurca ochricompacta TaxID=376703 RepID=A0AAD4M2A7_9AGAM|nr:hypothetical protein B0F90DRAFT_1728852 [Multifurca ochricompacta]